jgi:hypothetical protein
MTDADYRHIIVVMDRSGSIESILGDMQGGFNNFVAEQRKEPMRTTFSLWEFDDEIGRYADFVPLEQFTGYAIVPRGMTALNDAIMKATSAEGARLAAMPEDQRPGKVVLVIATDGLENRSTEFPGKGNALVGERIRHQEETYGWTVLYMGIGHDAFTSAAEIGISASNTLDSDVRPEAVQKAWNSTSDAVLRASRGGDASYTPAQRAASSK